MKQWSLSDEDEIEPQEGQEDEEVEELDEEDKQKIEDGEVCSNCGGTFAEAQGVESICPDCFKTMTAEDRGDLPESKSPTLP